MSKNFAWVGWFSAFNAAADHELTVMLTIVKLKLSIFKLKNIFFTSKHFFVNTVFSDKYLNSWWYRNWTWVATLSILQSVKLKMDLSRTWMDFALWLDLSLIADKNWSQNWSQTREHKTREQKHKQTNNGAECNGFCPISLARKAGFRMKLASIHSYWYLFRSQ